MLRRRTGVCALLFCLPHFAFAQNSQDPFLDATGVVETAGFETEAAPSGAPTSPAPIRQAGFAGGWQPASGTEEDSPGFSVFDSDPLADDSAFPPGTQPVQYPLDDAPYRGVPDGMPAQTSPGWTPPIVGGPATVE